MHGILDIPVNLFIASQSLLPKAEGRWSNFCRNLHKLCQVSELHPETKEHFRSYPSVVNERKIQLLQRSKVIHPMSLASLSWMIIMIVVNLCHMFVSTLRISYVIDPMHFTKCHYADKVLLVLHTICWIDIVVKFNTGFREPHTSIVILDRKHIAGHYLRSWFLPDIISCIPLSYIFLSIEPISSRYLLVSHFLPLLRTSRVYTTLVDVQIFLKLFTSSYIVHGSTQLAILFIMSTHWCGCLTYLPTIIAYYWNGFMPLNYNRFLKNFERNLLRLDFFTRYQLGLFITLSTFFGTGFTMFLASEPEELVVHSIIILYSTVFMVYTLVFLLKVYMTVFSSTIRYNELINQVEEYMKHKQFPVPLQKRVKAFYSHHYQKRYYKEESVLKCLSEELRNAITFHTCRMLVDKVALFKDVPAAAVGAVLGCLKPEVYLPNDPVIMAGDDASCMYFINYGTVAVYSLKGVEVCHVGDGGHFGEVSLLWRDTKRLVTVVAAEITQLYRLDIADFRQYLLSNQIMNDRIQGSATKRMHEIVLLDRAFRKGKEQLEE